MSLACAWHVLCLPHVCQVCLEMHGMCLACAWRVLGVYLACLQVFIMALSRLHVLSVCLACSVPTAYVPGVSGGT